MSVVVFPAPFGPSSATMSPSSTNRSRPLTAGVPRKDFVRPLASIAYTSDLLIRCGGVVPGAQTRRGSGRARSARRRSASHVLTHANAGGGNALPVAVGERVCEESNVLGEVAVPVRVGVPAGPDVERDARPA